LRNDPRLALPECWYWIRKLQARMYSADYVSAIKQHRRRKSFSGVAVIFRNGRIPFLWRASARGGTLDEASADERHRHLETLVRHQNNSRLGGELPRELRQTEPRLSPPRSHELKAATSTRYASRGGHPLGRANDFVHNEALANELARPASRGAWFSRNRARVLHDARYCYLRWVPTARSGNLDQLYPHLREGEPTPGPTSTDRGADRKPGLATVSKSRKRCRAKSSWKH